MVDLFDCSNRPSLKLTWHVVVHWKSTFAPLALLSCQGSRWRLPVQRTRDIIPRWFRFVNTFSELGSTFFSLRSLRVSPSSDRQHLTRSRSACQGSFRKNLKEFLRIHPEHKKCVADSVPSSTLAHYTTPTRDVKCGFRASCRVS